MNYSIERSSKYESHYKIIICESWRPEKINMCGVDTLKGIISIPWGTKDYIIQKLIELALKQFNQNNIYIRHDELGDVKLYIREDDNFIIYEYHDYPRDSYDYDEQKLYSINEYCDHTIARRVKLNIILGSIDLDSETLICFK